MVRKSLRPLIYLTVFLLSASSPCFSAEWDEGEKGWLLALTGPDRGAGDFGAETPEADRALLEKFRPRVIVSPRGLFPVDFYGFYLPNTVVRDRDQDGRIARRSPDRVFLKGVEREARYFLDYTGPDFPCSGGECDTYVASGYGRVYRERARLRTGEGTREASFTVLKYNFVFPYSGVPARLGFLKEVLLRLVADPVRFHELDIHGAVHIVLNERGEPAVLLLAQHNHFRSFIVDKDIPWPEDNRIQICFAERSNEPYPCQGGAGPALYRAVGNPVHMAFVIDGRSPPLFSGYDMVYSQGSGGREVPYLLKFLPSKDPLYVSWIPLGERKKVFFFFETWYRKGPPGADLNTWPELKAYTDIMQFWYLRDGSAEDAALMERAFRSFTDVDFEECLRINGSRLYQGLVESGVIDF